MDEKTLLFIAFAFSLFGLFMLYILAGTLDYDEKSILQINAEQLEDMVKIKGRIVSISNMGNITFLSIQQPEYIDVVVFDQISVREGETVEIIGSSEEYHNEMEIIAQRIRVVS